MYQELQRINYQELVREMRGGVTSRGELRRLPHPAEITSTLWERAQADDRILGESGNIIAAAIIARRELGQRGIDIAQLPQVSGDAYSVSISFPAGHNQTETQTFAVDDNSLAQGLSLLGQSHDLPFFTVAEALEMAKRAMSDEDRAIFSNYRKVRALVEALDQDSHNSRIRDDIFMKLREIELALPHTIDVPERDKRHDQLFRMKFMLVGALAKAHTPGSDLDIYTYKDGDKRYLRVVNTKGETISMGITPSILRRDEPFAGMTRQLAATVDENSAIRKEITS